MPEEVDVVVHFHGYSAISPSTKLMEYERDLSGLNKLALRKRPTIGLLPRGRRGGGGRADAYHHPTLSAQNGKGTTQLIEYGLAKLAEHMGRSEPFKLGRLIISAHSGGGKDSFPVITAIDPDEAFILDATYWYPPTSWAKARYQKDKAATAGMSEEEIAEYMATEGGAMRCVYIANTATASKAKGMNGALPAQSDPLFKYYNTVPSDFSHNAIPPEYNPKLIADATSCQDEPRACRVHKDLVCLAGKSSCKHGYHSGECPGNTWCCKSPAGDSEPEAQVEEEEEQQQSQFDACKSFPDLVCKPGKASCGAAGYHPLQCPGDTWCCKE